MWEIILLSLFHAAIAEKPNVEPEYLNMLRETGQHEEFARLLGLNDVSLVHPLEGRTEEDLMFTNVSLLGDILLTPEQEEQARQGINFGRHSDSKWKNNEIPYEFGRGEFTSSQRSKIKSAFQKLNSIMENVNIVPRSNQEDYVMVINGQGCYSNLGRIGGQQPLSLQSNGCMREGTMMHEMMHAMGIIHEHCRPDRDNYVKVLFENIEKNWRSQYEKVSPRSFQIFGSYDPYSVMHYPMTTSNGKPAFEFKDKRVNTQYVGQRVGPTKLDKQKGDALYS